MAGNAVRRQWFMGAGAAVPVGGEREAPPGGLWGELNEGAAGGFWGGNSAAAPRGSVAGCGRPVTVCGGGEMAGGAGQAPSVGSPVVAVPLSLPAAFSRPPGPV